MELKSLTCPNCGGVVQIPEGKSLFFCTFCGSQIHVDDGKITIDLNANIQFNQSYTDVARMRELDMMEQQWIRAEQAKLAQERLAEQKLLEENKKKQKWWKLVAVWSVINVILLIVGMGKAFLHDDAELNESAFGFCMLSFMFAPLILALLMPNKVLSKSYSITGGERFAMYFAIMFCGAIIHTLAACIILAIVRAVVI